MAGRLEQELRERGAVRVDVEGCCEREKGGDGAKGRQEAADASQSGDDLDLSVLGPWDSKLLDQNMILNIHVSIHPQHLRHILYICIRDTRTVVL